jgi:simple sugar transport system permease protein
MTAPAARRPAPTVSAHEERSDVMDEPATATQPGTPAPDVAPPPPVPAGDERLAKISPMARLLRRPEIGALLAAVVVAIFFWTQNSLFLELDGIANWTDVASTIGIPAVAVALLMIGGEFDLSAGVMTGSAGLMMGILATELNMNVWLAIVLTMLAAGAVGFTNGYMVMTTKLPSFIVTLATFFILQGVNLGVTKAITNQVAVSNIDSAAGYDSAKKLFGGSFWAPHDFRISVLWWILWTAIATWILARTRVGNWIFGVGGDANAARNVGVPVSRVKIGLFMTTSLVSALTGIMIALRLASTQAGQGVGDEFQYIIAAVVGGCVLTGGFGSAIGASLGATIIGMAFIGIQFSGWNTDWRFLFLGVILLVAVLVNNYIRKRAEGARR